MTSQELIIINLISECIELEAEFTVYDIIPEARDRGCNLTQSQIERLITSYRYPAYYKHSNVSKKIDDKSLSYILHYPMSKEPYGYDDIDVFKQLAKEKITSRNSIPKKSKPTLFDNRDRFCITADRVRLAGLKSGDKVYTKEQQGRIIIGKRDAIFSKGNPPEFSYPFTVDKSYNIRIHKSIFKTYLNKVPKQVDVIAEKGYLTIC